jgi:hypothetical protein
MPSRGEQPQLENKPCLKDLQSELHPARPTELNESFRSVLDRGAAIAVALFFGGSM